MSELKNLKSPWMVAVWPGMGQVALNAGVYLMAKLGMNMIAELESSDLFDVEHVEVKDGLIQTGRKPHNRIFLWKDPDGTHDLIVFLGEAQPPVGKYQFCRQMIEQARSFGVERIFTFAAMATQMHPSNASRVFTAATDQESLDLVKQIEPVILEEGQIGGLNGILLGVAAEYNMPGACLLGEMPHIFTQFPYPKASVAILEAFSQLSGINVDLDELNEQAESMEQQLNDLMSQVERAYKPEDSEGDEEEIPIENLEPVEAKRELTPAERRSIESLFTQSSKERSKAFELKRELDRLGVFKEYEDRFLDLFKKPNN